MPFKVLNRSSLKVSRLMFREFNPADFNWFIFSSNKKPLVVILIVSIFFIFIKSLIKFSNDGLSNGSPPVSLIFVIPNCVKMDTILIISLKLRISLSSIHLMLPFGIQ